MSTSVMLAIALVVLLVARLFHKHYRMNGHRLAGDVCVVIMIIAIILIIRYGYIAIGYDPNT